MHSQELPFCFLTDAFSTDDIKFAWRESNPVRLSERASVLGPDHELGEITTDDCSAVTMSGVYSCIALNVEIKAKKE